MKIPEHILQNLFIRYIPRAKKLAQHRCSGRCIVCGDSKKNLNKKRLLLLTKKEPYTVYCHNCGYTRRADLFFKQYFPHAYESIIGTIYDSFKGDFEIEAPSESFDNSLYTSAEFKELVDFLHEECVSLRDKSFLNKKECLAREYLENRRIPEEKIEGMYYCASPRDRANQKFKDYIIIPFYNEFDIPYYFQARYFGDDPNAVRYLTSDFECCPEKAIFGEKIVDTERTVFMVEGILDAMNVMNSISITGTGISDELIDYISGKFPDVIWLNDNDEAGVILTEKLLHLNKKCFIWPKKVKVKDINELACKMKVDYIPEEWIKRNSHEGIGGLGRLL